jgi:integrase
MSERLTKERIDELAAAADPLRDVLVWDAAVPGFVVRFRGGAVGFAFQYKIRGRTRRVSIGHYGPMTLVQARKIAQLFYVQLRSGSDPGEIKRESRRPRQTFAEIAELYLKDLRARAASGARRGKLSTAAEFERLLRRCVFPRIGRTEVDRLQLAEIEVMHRALAKTPRQANAALAVTSVVLNFAERRGLVIRGTNPCALVERLRERGRRERLTLAQLAELGALLRDAEAEGRDLVVVLALRVLALSGLRRSELVGHTAKVRRTDGSGLRWGDVDLDTRSVDLRDTKTGARIATLGRAAVDVLRRARPTEWGPSDYVCSGRVRGAPFVSLEKPARRYLQGVGALGGLHAFRRTFASIAAELGYSELIVAALLGHRRGGVTAKYVIAELDPVRAAADCVAARIAEQLNG